MRSTCRALLGAAAWQCSAMFLGGCGEDRATSPAPVSDPLASLLQSLPPGATLDAVLGELEAYAGELRFSPSMTEAEYAALSPPERDAVLKDYLADVQLWHSVVQSVMRPCLKDQTCPQRARVAAQLQRWVAANTRQSVVELFAMHADATDALVRQAR